MGGWGQVRSSQRPQLGFRQQVQVQRGLLQPWSLGHFGWNLSGRWGPTQEDQCPSFEWVPLPLSQGALKRGSGIHAAQAVCCLLGFWGCSGFWCYSGLKCCSGFGCCSGSLWEIAFQLVNLKQFLSPAKPNIGNLSWAPLQEHESQSDGWQTLSRRTSSGTVWTLFWAACWQQEYWGPTMWSHENGQSL